MRRLRRALLFLALIVIAALAISEALGWPYLRRPAETLLSRNLERQVRIAPPFDLHLIGHPRLAVGGLWLAAPAGFDLPHLLDAQDLAVELRYGDLWEYRQSGRMRIAAIQVGGIDLRLVRHPDGLASWQFGAPAGRQERPLPRVDRLQVRGGSLLFRDPALQADINARFNTQEGSDNAAPISHAEAEGQFRQRPFKGYLVTSGWLPVIAASPDSPPALATKGWLSYGGIHADFDGAISDPFGQPGVKGALTINGPSLGLLGRLTDTTLPTTPPFHLQGNIDKQGEIWRVEVGMATVGKSRLAGAFTFDPQQEPPRLDGQLSGAHFVLADLAPAFGTRTEDGKPVAPPPGRTIPDRPLDLPSLNKMEAHIKIDLERVDLGSAFAQPIAPLKAQLNLNRGQLILSDIEAATAKGRLRGAISIDARPALPRWRSDLTWDGIYLQEWLKGARARPREGRRNPSQTKPPPYFSGTLHGRAQLTGSGNSTAQLLGSLAGETTVFIRNGALSHLVIEILGLDVAQGLGLVMRGDETLPIRCAVADLQANNGLVKPKVALVDTPVTLILGDGTVNLAKERLDLRIVAKPKNVSPFTLRSPIHIQGSFLDPTATPEASPIAARVLAGVALGIANPLAAIIPFIDPGDQVGSPCNQVLSTLKR